MGCRIARDGCDYVVPTGSRIIGTRHGDEQNDLHVSMLYFHPKCAENGKDAKALLIETNGTKRFGLPYAEATHRRRDDLPRDLRPEGPGHRPAAV